MKLLIITQVVSDKHPVLGFFINWINEFSKTCEQVTVVCLEEGESNLSQNVKVLSLGKEKGASKAKQLFNFYNHILQERQNYDVVFVHMNQLYVILGWIVWKVMGKKVGLWYTHGTVTSSLKLATKLTDYIFTASHQSFNIETKKKIVTGHGIDMDQFGIVDQEREIDLITIGRVSKTKNLHTLIEAVTPLVKSHNVNLHIVGATVTKEDETYQESLVSLANEKGIGDSVVFRGPIPYSDLASLRNNTKVFVTAAQNGSLDKVMLEAMASGMPVVSMAPGSLSLPLGDDQVSNSDELTNALLRVIESGNYRRNDYVTYVKENHSLERLVSKILSVY